MATTRLGLTFADVLLVPKRTPLSSRTEADVKTKFTKNISLNIPLVSANMATVTEHKMAIAVAREGGLGVIHQFGTIEEQVAEIKKVKKSTSFVIENPISVSPTVTIEEASRMMREEGVTSLLVIENNQLAGIFTSRDYLFETNTQKKISEVMTPREKLITASPTITLEDDKKILHQHRIEKLPLIEENQVKGLITTKDIKKLEQWQDAARDTKGRLLVGAAIGVKDALERAKAVIDAGADVLILDIAHAHSDYVIQRLKNTKQLFPLT